MVILITGHFPKRTLLLVLRQRIDRNCRIEVVLAPLALEQDLQLALEDLDALPALTKEVFVRYRLKGETYEQIARDCGLTVAVIRRRLRDAMIFLVKQRGQREDG